MVDCNKYMNTLLLLLLQSEYIAASTVYTVTSDDHYYPNTTCHNLQHYLLNITKYFTSNTQLLFLPGLHHLHTDLIIQNVHNISLIGSTTNGTTLDTVIQCNSSVGILMNNITNLTLTDIKIKNCKYDGYNSAAVFITIYTNVLWRRITVDSISSNGIIGINVLGDSCFSNIKSHTLRINYNDTQSAQNNSNHTLLIDHYLITDQSRGQQQLHILKFIFSQHFYKVKITLANAKISSLNNTDVAVYVLFKAKCLHQNEVVLRNSQFTHNYVTGDLLYIKVSEHLAVSNSIVQINTCLFSDNIGNNPFAIIKIAGVISQVSISDCKFYRNEGLTMIAGVHQNLFLTNLYISNTSFSLNTIAKIVYLSFVKLHLQGPVIFHNNTCSISILTVRLSEVKFTNYIEFSANKVPALIRHVGEAYAYRYM